MARGSTTPDAKATPTAKSAREPPAIHRITLPFLLRHPRLDEAPQLVKDYREREHDSEGDRRVHRDVEGIRRLGEGELVTQQERLNRQLEPANHRKGEHHR